MDLAADTAVRPLDASPGWYVADLPPNWNFRTPSGGVLMTVALRAMRAELADPELIPRSATTLFCSPVPEGSLEIQVAVLRRGRAAVQLRASLTSCSRPGPGLEVSATFAREREGFDFTDAEFPPVPGPDAAPKLSEAVPFARFTPPFFSNLESRRALGDDWWVGEWKGGVARYARWLRYRVPQTTPDGFFDALALPPLADTMPPSVVQKLGPGFEPFVAPSLDLTLHFLEATRREWLLVSAHCRRARAGYASAEVDIWDDEKRLVAYGTQVMMIRKPPADVRKLIAKQ
jgi:acyl-CoA thioesterase